MHRPARMMIRAVAVLGLLAVTISCGPVFDDIPVETTSAPPVSAGITDTTIEFQEPGVPSGGGTGLPATDGASDDEVDCDNAEELCDSGEWACDDIADYCDIGPDDGSGLPDDWDWDR